MSLQNKEEVRIFHNNVSAIGNGIDVDVTNDNSMKLEFESTETFSVTVLATLATNNFKPIPVFKLGATEMSQTNPITDSSAFYEIDIACFDKVRVQITAITGTLSVYGRAVG